MRAVDVESILGNMSRYRKLLRNTVTDVTKNEKVYIRFMAKKRLPLLSVWMNTYTMMKEHLCDTKS